VRGRSHEANVLEFLSRWGPPVPETAGDIALPDFDEQCQALLRIAPAALSSIMGLYPLSFVSELKTRRIAWFATATTVVEAKKADAPVPAPYPVQRGLTTPMLLEAGKTGDVQRMQAWAGQSAALARAESASHYRAGVE
jgi:NAD(P)H-dependent flavin oxidoreductase YrpB (nitropropane dioxygenase family)